MTDNSNNRLQAIINSVTDSLCAPDSYEAVYHRSMYDVSMPSTDHLQLAVEMLRTVLFPGYFGNSDLHSSTMAYYIGSTIDRASKILMEQIKRGYCFVCAENERDKCRECDERSRIITEHYIGRLPKIRGLLATDVRSAYEGDPAAKNPGETIFCYPSIRAVTNYRIAHELFDLGVPLIPRIITEMAHSQTGIDIHPGAEIGEYFFIDHGTGVVIGETCVIGSNVRIYQGVTLGAKSFPLDGLGNPIKGIPRHPIVEDDVIIYSGATILGRITIGRGSVVGGNVWLTHDIPPFANITQAEGMEMRFEGGSGI